MLMATVSRTGVFHGINKVFLKFHVFSVHSSPLRAALYNRAGHEKMAEVEFSEQHPGELMGGYRYRDINPVLLPRDFLGSVVVFNLTAANPIHSA